MSDQLSEKIKNFLSDGAKSYAQKDFEKSVELYAEACEAFNEESEGKDNADLLFLYGKALFQLAVSNSEVLGGAGKKESDNGKSSIATDTEKKEENKASVSRNNDSRTFQFDQSVLVAEEDDEDDEDSEEREERKRGKDKAEEKQEESDAEGDEGDKQNDNESEEEQEEEESDFELAWNILDLARALFEKQLEDHSSQENSEIMVTPLRDDDTPVDNISIVKKKLSETYDILGEVSLEAENYTQASKDFQKSLDLRKALYTDHSALISESYYKLSLAWEFVVDDDDARAKAAEAMEKAIETVKKNPDVKDKKDQADLITELQDRLEDLRKDPLKEEKDKIVKGLLGEVISEVSKEDSSSSLAKQPEELKRVNDLTSMVKKRKGPKVMKPTKKAKK